jgi:hypothetical protein
MPDPYLPTAAAPSASPQEFMIGALAAAALDFAPSTSTA